MLVGDEIDNPAAAWRLMIRHSIEGTCRSIGTMTRRHYFHNPSATVFDVA
jgi:hypothetical protein